MLKYYFETTRALKRLREDKDGMVSLEYILVGSAIIAMVSAAFATGPLSTAIGAAMTTIGSALTSAITAA
jgi:pilus assembly protein Flp/PilA